LRAALIGLAGGAGANIGLGVSAHDVLPSDNYVASNYPCRFASSSRLKRVWAAFNGL
jgi:hypothetical protein